MWERVVLLPFLACRVARAAVVLLAVLVLHVNVLCTAVGFKRSVARTRGLAARAVGVERFNEAELNGRARDAEALVCADDIEPFAVGHVVRGGGRGVAVGPKSKRNRSGKWSAALE